VKSETEIREKLEYYEVMLAGIEAGRAIDIAGIFLNVSEHFPKEALEVLHISAKVDELLSILPTEDQPWVRQWFSSLGGFAREVLTSRISILRWTLEGEKEGRGVTGDQGI